MSQSDRNFHLKAHICLFFKLKDKWKVFSVVTDNMSRMLSVKNVNISILDSVCVLARSFQHLFLQITLICH